VPNTDSAEKLGEAHTRLLLKGARRVFLWDLGAAIETVLNEEIAAAGAIRAATLKQKETPSRRKDSKHQLKGTEGLVRKTDLSQYKHYMDNLTEKQQLAFSLRHEYGLGLTEIASRMGLNRKTAYEHIEAARRKIDQVRSGEKAKAQRAKNTRE
jgi:DNA-directed RNA polymerase specialized sigma24 family protein